jgi:uncharacterized cupin superfamily protein
MDHVAHWDDVAPYRRESGHIGADWHDLGKACASVTVGVKRIRIDPGKWSTPLHVEGSDEEIFFVLGGSGLSVHRIGDEERAHALRANDCVVYPAVTVGHTVQAGEGGIDLLAFGMRTYLDGAAWLPRAGIGWFGPKWFVLGGEEDHPFTREAAIGPPDVREISERPGSILNVDEVEPDIEERRGYAGAWRELGRLGGSERTLLNHVELEPGSRGSPPHCHGAEEELFVVLGGEGVLELGEETFPLREGSLVSRPAATGVPHALRAGEVGLTYLAYSTREPNDIVYFPRSNKVYLRGIKMIARVEKLDYWDGEEEPPHS